MIEDNIPDVLQDARLGHSKQGVRGIYSHVTDVMTTTLLAALQQRWEQAGRDLYPNRDVVKIVCSQIAPRNAERPAGEDHRQAV
ncbi:hypothetical protein [Alloactinosynnema sp. L-07]|uniref:hypothetical protein n=1 Tax=Alloactinosynnema sp. L-07 TaxID=1653480 RepID=UPI00065F08F3|nr:hypothetical protein [Alloactinosynnema sp. L-07]CRK58178.1 hypothetical protein [Alloactinosynnema sp. L-07]